MNNSEIFYQTVQRFVKARDNIDGEYAEAVETAEKARGSELYDELVSRAAQTREAALTVIRGEVGPVFESVLTSMKENAANRPLPAITQEQLRLLTVLQMREHITEAELRQAAITFQGNSVCCAVLDDLAQKHDYPPVYGGYASQMLAPVAERYIETLARSTRDLLQGNDRYCSRVGPDDAMDEVLTRMCAMPRSVKEDRGLQRVQPNTGLTSLFCAAVDGEV